MLLRDGAVVAAGLARDVLKSEPVSETFGMPLRVVAAHRPLVRPRRLGATGGSQVGVRTTSGMGRLVIFW